MYSREGTGHREFVGQAIRQQSCWTHYNENLARSIVVGQNRNCFKTEEIKCFSATCNEVVSAAPYRQNDSTQLLRNQQLYEQHSMGYSYAMPKPADAVNMVSCVRSQPPVPITSTYGSVSRCEADKPMLHEGALAKMDAVQNGFYQQLDLDHAEKVARTRYKQKMRAASLRSAFSELQRCNPYTSGYQKRLERVTLLRMTIKYIQDMQRYFPMCQPIAIGAQAAVQHVSHD
uniref:BHLH domain-containing protein n=1 Tax=Trichuris muris TaxID=70415 RepID=A0A5S6QWF2_TRIMR